MENSSKWLVEGPSWIAHRARRDLLGQTESAADVKAARKAMLADPAIRRLLADVAKWPGPVLTSHKSADHPLHKLVFLADLGFSVKDPVVARVADRILAHIDSEGPFQVRMNIPAHFGGSGKDTWAWALCDSPSLIYALAKMGLAKDARVRMAARHLETLVRPNGWPCAVSPELGRFRGPGRKNDPCPYANLVMVKALAQLPDYRDGAAIRAGAESILDVWKHRKTEHPYMFYMGTDFSKLKAPFIWFDLLHVLDVLTQLPWLKSDGRLREMTGVLEKKLDADGRAIPESVWLAWKDWEFGQKKTSSRWLTLTATRILKRLE